MLDEREDQHPHLRREDVKTFRDVHHHPHHLPPRPALSALGALRHPLPDPTTTTAFEGQGMSWVNVTTDFK